MHGVFERLPRQLQDVARMKRSEIGGFPVAIPDCASRHPGYIFSLAALAGYGNCSRGGTKTPSAVNTIPASVSSPDIQASAMMPVMMAAEASTMPI